MEAAAKPAAVSRFRCGSLLLKSSRNRTDRNSAPNCQSASRPISVRVILLDPFCEERALRFLLVGPTGNNGMSQMGVWPLLLLAYLESSEKPVSKETYGMCDGSLIRSLPTR